MALNKGDRLASLIGAGIRPIPRPLRARNCDGQMNSAQSSESLSHERRGRDPLGGTPRLRAVRGLRRPTFVSALSLCLGLVIVSGCTRPTGDFGRAKETEVHDTIMPALGEKLAQVRGEPVSKANYTDDEELMRKLAWELIRPANSRDWIGGTVVELSRTRVLPESQGLIPEPLYYNFLNSEKFQSSDARFDRVAGDARGDASLIPPYCKVAIRVEDADLERSRALAGRTAVTQETYKAVKSRVWENRRLTDWVAVALRYRVKAYKYAVDNLELQTPTRDRLWQTNTALRELEEQVRLVENDCRTDDRYGMENAPRRHSRVYQEWVNKTGTGGEETCEVTPQGTTGNGASGQSGCTPDRGAGNTGHSRIYDRWGLENPAPIK